METETEPQAAVPQGATLPGSAGPPEPERTRAGTGGQGRGRPAASSPTAGWERRQRALPWKWRSSPPARCHQCQPLTSTAHGSPRAPAEAAQLRAAGCASHQLPWRRWAAYGVQYRAMGYWYGNNLQLYLWTSFFHIYALIHKNKILYMI